MEETVRVIARKEAGLRHPELGKRLGITTIEDRIKANPERVVAGIIAAIIASVLVVWLTSLSGLFDGPTLQMVDSSSPSPVYADGTYSDVQVATNNAGNVTAEGCSVKAYNHLLFSSSDPDETLALGESEWFSLPPQGGRSATVSIYLPYLSGEALLGGGVRSLIFLRTECSNAMSETESKMITLSGSPPSISETDYGQPAP